MTSTLTSVERNERKGAAAYDSVLRRASAGASEADLLRDLELLEIPPSIIEMALQDYRAKIKKR